MAEFDVNIPILKANADKQSEMLKQLDEMIQKIDNLQKPIATQGDAFEDICNELKKVRDGVLAEKKDLEKIKNCLNDVATFYEKAEQAILAGEHLPKELKELAKKIKEQLEETGNNGSGSNQDTSAYGGDPVNMCTGNYVISKEEIKLVGLMPLYFMRHYNAMQPKKGVMGYGWSHNYDVTITSEDNKLYLKEWDNKEECYIQISENRYASVYGGYDFIEQVSEGYRYKNSKGIIYEFNELGRLVKIRDTSDNEIILKYEENRLVQVTNNSQCSLQYEYNEEGLLVSVCDHTGRKIKLEYKAQRLVKVIDVLGQETHYAYNEKNGIVHIINALGVKAIENTYDEAGRMIKQVFPNQAQMQYAYDDTQQTMTYTECNGAKWTYCHDQKMRHIATCYEDGTVEKTYNEKNDLISVTNRNGARIQYTYDDRGNITSVIDALGYKTSYTYNASNKLTVEKKPNGKKVHYKYNEQEQLRALINEEGYETTYEYNEFGKIKRIIRADGSQIQFKYDDRGNVISRQEGQLGAVCFGYDVLNRLSWMMDANSNQTTYAYDEKDHIVEITDALGQKKNYTYDKMDRMVEEKDFDGQTRQWLYNDMNQVIRYVDKEGACTEAVYDEMGNVAKVIDAEGGITIYSYNHQNKLEKVKNALGVEMTYQYDKGGNCIQKSIDGKIIYTAVYDKMNHKIEEHNLLGEEMKYAYDVIGNLVKQINVLGQEKTFNYDGCGHLIKEKGYEGYETQYAYTQLGNLAYKIEANGGKTSYEYEMGGQLAKVINPDGTYIQYTYDAVGNKKDCTLQNGYQVTYEYDPLNRLIQMKSSIGQSKKMAYDEIGNVIAVTDGNDHTTTYRYDGNQQLIEVIDPLGSKVRYEYNKVGQLIKIKQMGEEEEHLTTYERNLLGQIEKVRTPIGTEQVFSYDALGHVVSKIDEEGQETTYTYDEHGKVNVITYADGQSVKMKYDALKHLTQYEDWLGMTKLNYDAFGLLQSVTDPKGNTVAYEWGTMGERKAIIYPDGRKVSYEYDEAMRLVNVLADDLAVDYHYNTDGYLKEKDYSNGVKTSYLYNEVGYLTKMTSEDEAGTLQEYEYQYDKMGNRIAVSESKRNQLIQKKIYKYDAMNRLAKIISENGWTRSYAYDAFGNRTLIEDEAGKTYYYYNARNQLIKKENGHQDQWNEQSLQYDLRGNLIQMIEDGQEMMSMTFNARNKLEVVTQMGGVKIQYGYDGLGHRVMQNYVEMPEKGFGAEQVIHEKTMHYINDITKKANNLLVQEEKGEKQSYLWDDRMIAMTKQNSAGHPENLFYLLDGMGSVVGLVNHAGEIMNQYTYDAFGRQEVIKEEVQQPFAYTGYQKESGFYFAQARYYNESMGRFISCDTIKGFVQMPETLNEYAYCINNPLKYVDEDGEFWTIAIGAGVGAVINTGFEVWDQIQDGSFDITSAKTWEKIGVSAAQGAIEGGVAGSGAGLPALAASVFGTEFAGSTVKNVINGDKIGWSTIGENALDAAINTATTLGLSAAGGALFKKLTKLYPKFINQAEMKDIVDWLAKYAKSGAPDAAEAAKILASYGLQEAAVDTAVNRSNKFLDDTAHTMISPK